MRIEESEEGGRQTQQVNIEEKRVPMIQKVQKTLAVLESARGQVPMRSPHSDNAELCE